MVTKKLTGDHFRWILGIKNSGNVKLNELALAWCHSQIFCDAGDETLV
jgi:hypothetical protein